MIVLQCILALWITACPIWEGSNVARTACNRGVAHNIHYVYSCPCPARTPVYNNALAGAGSVSQRERVRFRGSQERSTVAAHLAGFSESREDRALRIMLGTIRHPRGGALPARPRARGILWVTPLSIFHT
jgi:hypothetical protein